MAANTYKDALSKEIEQLKKENADLIKYIRPQTLEAMGTKTPDDILKKTSLAFWAKRIAIVLAVLAIAVGAAFIVGSFIEEVSVPFAEDDSLSDPDFIPDPTDSFNTVGSSTANSRITKQGHVYYTSQDGYVYKYVDKAKVQITSAPAEHLNAYKYCLYYYDGEDNTVYRIRTDGQGKIPLMINIIAADLKVYKNTVYVLTDEGDIHSVYINGKKGYPVLEEKNIQAFTIADGHIYYITEGNDGLSLYRAKTSGTETVKVSDTDSALIAASNGYVFYVYKGTLFGLDTEEEKAHAFFSGQVTDFILMGDSIFIISDHTLYASDTTGGNIEKIASEISSVDEISIDDIITYAEERQGDK